MMRPFLLGGLSTLAALGVAVWIATPASFENNHTKSNGAFRCAVSRIVDGDTLDCEGGPRVRLAGVNARERDGTCYGSAPCPVSSYESAAAELTRLATGQVLDCQANGATYGRTAAFCRTAAGVDLSCAMLETGTVAIWSRYWGEHRC